VSRRIRARLVWGQTPAKRGYVAAFSPAATTKEAPEPAVSGPSVGFEMPLAPRERAVALLHVGAEIEHALMVQYLYGAYSLNEHQSTPERQQLVKRWRGKIAEVAREEMGHLASVQNILTLIGGPLCFERDDFPIIDPELWPFPFELEPLTKDSLAKYVLAEAPSDEVLEKFHLKGEVDAIRRRLHCDSSLSVNRVGLIYGDILQLFQAGPMVEGPQVPGAPKPFPFVPTVDIQADSVRYQVSHSAWGLGYPEILIRTAHDRSTALAALTAVSEQGEGPISPDESIDPNTPTLEERLKASHFYRFLEVYREFPEESAWRPSYGCATNPTTKSSSDQSGGHQTVLEGDSVPWALLANLRYRMLLMYLEHSFQVETPTAHPARSPRAALITWSFGEMYNLRSLSEILMTMPSSEGSDTLAGPPFEMPYSLSLATREVNRWRGHRDLLLASLQLVGEMLPKNPEHHRYLTALRTADTTALAQVEALIGA
jgi:hypothetical protein